MVYAREEKRFLEFSMKLNEEKWQKTKRVRTGSDWCDLPVSSVPQIRTSKPLVVIQSRVYERGI